MITANEIFNRLVAEPHTRKAALAFAEVLAYQLDGAQHNELRWSIDELARELGISEEIKIVCQSLTAADNLPVEGETPALAPADAPHGEAPDSEEDGVKTLNGTTEHKSPMDSTPLAWGGVPPRNGGFMGRNEVLEDISRSLPDHATSALIAPLHGLGGVGKSQVATEFAYRHQLRYDLIWWVQADDEQSIRRSLVSLARRLQLLTSEDVQDMVETVLDALRRGKPYDKWLLIYDDAAELGDPAPYLPSSRGRLARLHLNRGADCTSHPVIGGGASRTAPPWRCPDRSRRRHSHCPRSYVDSVQTL